MKRNEDSLRDIWGNIKCANIHIIGVPGEEREKGPEKIFEEIIAENFPNLGKETVTEVQETQRVPYRINPQKNTPWHIVIKMTKIKDKERILKTTREKQQIFNIQGNSHNAIYQLTFGQKFCRPEEWHNILKVMKEKNLQPRILHPVRLSFRFEGEIKSFTGKQKLKEFNTTKQVLQQMLKELL